MSAIEVGLWLLIILVPGLAIVRLLRVPGTLVELVAFAAPLSFGFLYLAGIAASRVSLPALGTCFVATGLLLIAWVAGEVLRVRTALRANRREGTSEVKSGSRSLVSAESHQVMGWFAGWRDPSIAISRALLVFSVGLGLYLWRGLHADLATPAGWDAMHLGYFVRQIADHNTLNGSVVLSTDPSSTDVSAFYPQGLTLLAALLHVGTGVRISTVILSSTTALGGVILPVGTYVLVRRLSPHTRLLAGFAALGSVLPMNMFTIEYLGRTTAIAGLTLVPGAVCVILSLGERIDWRLTVLGSLTFICLIGVHTSELLIVAGLVTLIAVVNSVRTRRWRALVVWLAYLAAIGILAVVLLLLADPGIRYLVGQRTGAFISPHGGSLPVHIAIQRFVLMRTRWAPGNLAMQVWSAVALAGCVATLHRRWWRLAAPSIAYLGFGAFWVAWIAGHVGPFTFFADPWYRDAGRMNWEFAVLGAIPVGIAFASVAGLISGPVMLLLGRIRRPAVPQGRRAWAWPSALAGAALVVGSLLAYAVPPTGAASAWMRTDAAPVGADSRATFQFLQRRVAKNDRVLDDLDAHGDLWMFVDYGVPTLFGNPPLIGAAPASWKERLYLRGQFRHIDTDSCIRYLLVKYRVTYVYYSATHMVDATRHITLGTLRDRRFFLLAFARGGVRVFKVRPIVAPVQCAKNLTQTYPWSTLHNAK